MFTFAPGGDWITTAKTTTLSELEALSKEHPYIEYHGCDDSYYYFRVEDHGYFRVKGTEKVANLPDLQNPYTLPAGASCIFVKIRDGKVVTPEPNEVLESLEPLPNRYPWLNPLILATVVLIVWLIWRRRWPMRIVVDQSGVRSHHGLPKSQERQILAFLQEEVKFMGKVTIGVSRERNGRLQTHFTGPLDAGMKQRIRNFLISVL